MVMYQMITGDYPFGGRNIDDLKQNHAQGVYKVPKPLKFPRQALISSICVCASNLKSVKFGTSSKNTHFFRSVILLRTGILAHKHDYKEPSRLIQSRKLAAFLAFSRMTVLFIVIEVTLKHSSMLEGCRWLPRSRHKSSSR